MNTVTAYTNNGFCSVILIPRALRSAAANEFPERYFELLRFDRHGVLCSPPMAHCLRAACRKEKDVTAPDFLMSF